MAEAGDIRDGSPPGLGIAQYKTKGGGGLFAPLTFNFEAASARQWLVSTRKVKNNRPVFRFD